MQKIQTQEEGGKRFVTLAGHQPAGNLVYVSNEAGDVESVRETLNKKLKGNFRDYDLEKHYIDPPEGGGFALATKLEHLAEKYVMNTLKNPVKYDLWDENCSTWVNTLLKVAGVSASARQKAGEFNGFDWGEEDMLDENLFK